MKIMSPQCFNEVAACYEVGVQEIYEYWNDKKNLIKHRKDTKGYCKGGQEIYQRLKTTRFTIDDMKNAIDVYDQILTPDFIQYSLFFKCPKTAKIPLYSFFCFDDFYRNVYKKTAVGKLILKDISWFRFCRKGIDYCKDALLIDPISTSRNSCPKVVKTLQTHIADLRKHTYASPENFTLEEKSCLITASKKLNIIYERVKNKMKDDDPSHFYTVLYYYMRDNALTKPIFLASDRTIGRFECFLEDKGYLNHPTVYSKRPISIKRFEEAVFLGETD